MPENPQDKSEQPAEDKKKPASPFEDLSKKVNITGARLRVLEERYANLRKKSQMTDQNLLDFEKDLREEIKVLNQDFLEIKRGISDINENLILMSSELRTSVKQTDFKVIEKYIDMWQPMDFVTREEFNKYLSNK